ncbi:MAG: hypothetical protein JXA42_00550 [Anaerolineales bacterium]|nr:hypothetical protein [Anaerolineales bacterium]
MYSLPLNQLPIRPGQNCLEPLGGAGREGRGPVGVQDVQYFLVGNFQHGLAGRGPDRDVYTPGIGGGLAEGSA